MNTKRLFKIIDGFLLAVAGISAILLTVLILALVGHPESLWLLGLLGVF